MKNATWMIISYLLFLSISSMKSQDMDQDGINDQLELALARRFAPEWRFHRELPNDGSNQNQTEAHYPSSIEWFYNYIVQQTGQPPNLWYVPYGSKAPITNISQLAAMIVPGTGLTAGDPTWGNCNNGDIRISDYPEKIPGDPNGFPTYYHCYLDASTGMISIGYLLFYPFDYKGRYWFFGWQEPGKHRGDWEGVNALVSGVNDLNDPNEAVNASLVSVKYSGHGPRKYIEATSPRFRSVHGTHPKVYIAYGAHACYPEPGNWNNYIVSGWTPNWYDDYFHGNGLVVQSWLPPRNLINLGETGAPLVGWLNYKGWWGPDDNGENSSPPSPPCKSPWTASLAGYLTWEEALEPENYNQYWENPFHLDCSPELATQYSPDPNYNCDIYVDYRVTCPGENPPLPTIEAGVLQISTGGQLGIFPGQYSENLLISKSLTLKAIEGAVVIGN